MLATMLAVGAVLRGSTAAAPPHADTPVALLTTVMVLGAVSSCAVWYVTERWRDLTIQAVLVLHLGVNTLMVATSASGAGALTAAYGYIWLAVYVAIFRSHRFARLYMCGVVVLSGYALAVGVGGRSAFSAWLVAALTSVVGVELLARVQQRLRGLSTTDPLTGSLNRLGLEQAAAVEIADATRHGAVLTVAVIDLDGFKQVNDRHGHAAGDLALADIADAWRTRLRPRDLLARYGGDEFILLLPDTDEAGAVRLLERLARVSGLAWTSGIAAVEADGGLEDAVLRADRRMYARKVARSDGCHVEQDMARTSVVSAAS